MTHNQANTLSEGIILASYPRSGSNWFRIIMATVFPPNDKSLSYICNLGDEGPCETLNFRGRPQPVFKTHMNAEKLQRAVNATALITIQRHPLDVLLSAMNFLNATQQPAFFRNATCRSVEDILKDGDMEYYIDKFCAEDGVSQFARGCGAYSSFYTDLRKCFQSRPSLNLRYEDLFANPDEGIRQLYHFVMLSHNCDAPQIRARVDARTSKFAGFKKTAYTHRLILRPDQIARFRARYADKLSSLGYSPTEEQEYKGTPSH